MIRIFIIYCQRARGVHPLSLALVHLFIYLLVYFSLYIVLKCNYFIYLCNSWQSWFWTLECWPCQIGMFLTQDACSSRILSNCCPRNKVSKTYKICRPQSVYFFPESFSYLITLQQSFVVDLLYTLFYGCWFKRTIMLSVDQRNSQVLLIEMLHN